MKSNKICASQNFLRA